MSLFFRLFLVTLLLGPGLACKKNDKKVITSSDGRFQITVPGGWNEDKDLHEDAELQASHRASQQFIIILAENKADLFEMDLAKHSEITRSAIKEGLKNIQETGPSSLTIGGFPALQYEIRGVKDNLNLIYIHTTVESSTYLYQILAWTVPSRYEKDPQTLKKITTYFEEVKN